MTSGLGDATDDVVRALAGLAPEPIDLMPRIFAWWCRVDAPIGEVFVAFTERGVCYLRSSELVLAEPMLFSESFRARFRRPVLPAPRPPDGLESALRTGELGELRLDLRDLTEFERAVLVAAGRIPVGEVRPYTWIAREIGRPAAAGGVGTALVRNPVPLLVPCHRVIHPGGDVGGYVLGRQVKERLLRAEMVNLDEVRVLAGRRVYYLGCTSTNVVCFPTCQHVRAVTEEYRRGFRTVDEAVAAGYLPCPHCRPGH
ncbi:MAG TPA: methylated-DNA--[protein]-cysteine S-methyltransferase [Pseudonocardiaceae bacterium]|jgi:O-6-methylguanine DNA methyltransferase